MEPWELAARVERQGELLAKQAAVIDALVLVIGPIIASHPKRQAVADAARQIAELQRHQTMEMGFEMGHHPSQPAVHSNRTRDALEAILRLGEAGSEPPAGTG